MAAEEVANPNFDTIVEWLLTAEGGYAGDDRGAGWVKYGITQSSLISHGLKEIKPEDITREWAKEFYRRFYWEGSGFHQVPYERVRAILFVQGVNQGPQRLIKWLQKLISFALDGFPVAVDGILGPWTLKGLSWIVGRYGEPWVCCELLDRCLGHYLALNDPRYFKGWYGRLRELARFLNLSWEPMRGFYESNS